jgi:conjugative transfer signal peptidase TraF
MSLFRRIAIVTTIGALGILAAGAALHAAGARINTTKSIPLGLYWAVSKPVEKGDYVFFCPPPLGVFDMARSRHYIAGGFCPGNYSYMMKRVLAAKGDAITIADDGVRVNGQKLPYTAVLKADPGGRPMPRYQANSYTLAPSQLLLMGDINPLSFDGRYFGPINRAQIKTVVVPVYTW